MVSLRAFLEALLIVTALSLDTFVSCFSYGANKIKIPFSSITVINLICCAFFAASLFLGAVIGPFLPPGLTTAFSFALLFILGIAKLFDGAVKAFIRKNDAFKKKIRFSAFSLKFILSIYADPEEADSDHSRILSPSEAVYLAVALSLDSLAVGFGAGIASSSPVLLIALCLIVNKLCAIYGCRLGDRFTKGLSLDLSWLSGAMLVGLAAAKLF